MKLLQYTYSFLRLIRWINLVIITATMYLLRYFVMIPMLESYGMNNQLSDFHFMLLTLSTVILTAAGYIINDIYDLDADNINKPDKVIIGNYISTRLAENIYMALNVIAIGIGIYISFKIDVRFVSLAFILVAGLLYFYSTSYKGQLILGNFIVSVFAATVPMMVLLFELPLLRKKYNVFEITSAEINLNPIIIWIVIFSVFAFLISFAREIIKDLEDIEGDSNCEVRTLPVAYGTKISKIAILAFLSLIFFLVGYISVIYLNDPVSFFYITTFISIPVLYTMWIVFKGKQKADFLKASTMCKLIMFSGVMYCFIVKYVLFD